MREIKFRAWNTTTKTMVDLKKITPLALDIDTDGLFIPFSDGLILMQYTGLKDKDGKEIYEEDIIKISTCGCRDPKCKMWQDVKPSLVSWKDFYWRPFFNFGNTTQCNSENYEVIGNIYENIDLL